MIWISILGVAPFTLLLPHVDRLWTALLSVIIGLILASAFSVSLVYARELVRGKVGAISSLFFGMGGIGAALLGQLADATSIETVYQVCAYLPLIGLLKVFLPTIRTEHEELLPGDYTADRLSFSFARRKCSTTKSMNTRVLAGRIFCAGK